MSGWETPAPIMEKDGPGKWDIMHLKTFAISSYQDKLDFIELFYFIIDTLKCGNCVNHANMYVTAHPIEAYIDNLAEYMVDFHNAVNKRLGKSEVSYENAKEMYTTRLRDYMIRKTALNNTMKPNHVAKTTTGPVVTKENVVVNSTRPVTRPVTRTTTRPITGARAVQQESNNMVNDKPCETCGANSGNSTTGSGRSTGKKFTVNYSVNGKTTKVSATDFTPMYLTQ